MGIFILFLILSTADRKGPFTLQCMKQFHAALYGFCTSVYHCVLWGGTEIYTHSKT